MKNKWLIYVILGGVAYYVSLVLASRKKAIPMAVQPKLKAPLPPAAVLTGTVKVTMNNRPPNYPDDTVGYGRKAWAEYKLADGRTEWVEVEG